MKSTAENPFQLYFEIAFNNELEKIQASYLNNKELIDSGFEYLPQHNYYIKDEMIVDKNPPIFETTIITREKYLKDLLLKERKELYAIISNNKEQILTYFNDLSPIYDKVESLKNDVYYEIILLDIKEIISDLKIQYLSIVGHHKIFNKIREYNSSQSFFQCKDLPYSFFEKLYEKTYELDLIDDVLISETDFIEVLITHKHNDIEFIQFLKPNAIVSYYLKQIEVFFNNFNAVGVEKSKAFLNKQGKPITSTDIYTALSRKKDKDKWYFEKISVEINQLKNRYLK